MLNFVNRARIPLPDCNTAEITMARYLWILRLRRELKNWAKVSGGMPVPQYGAVPQNNMDNICPRISLSILLECQDDRDVDLPLC